MILTGVRGPAEGVAAARSLAEGEAAEEEQLLGEAAAVRPAPRWLQEQAEAALQSPVPAAQARSAG